MSAALDVVHQNTAAVAHGERRLLERGLRRRHLADRKRAEHVAVAAAARDGDDDLVGDEDARARGRLQLRKNAEFFLDGAPLADLGDGPKEFAALIEKDTCFVVAKDVRAGEHELEVRAKSSSGNDYVAMSHVLFF